MRVGWRLERTYLAGAGYPESRLEGLDIHWSDPFEPSGHAALWADNGTGKSTITALRFALYLPHPRDFVRGDSDRSLSKLVPSGRVCHVVEQATREVNGELQRLVVGMVASWQKGRDNAEVLKRYFYGWVTGPDGPTIHELPFHTVGGRWATSDQFTDAIRQLMPRGGALPPHSPSEHQDQWGMWLSAADVDLTQMRFQAAMNASEGGVEHVMRFTDSDDFVRWLVGTITPTSTVEQIGTSIDVLRENAKARPRWLDELTFWDRVIDPLLDLAVTHEDVSLRKREVAMARVGAAAVISDADATIGLLTIRKNAAAEQYEHHEQRRKDASMMQRRAQGHRLRMQLRAAKLRADVAAGLAEDRRRIRDETETALSGWRMVADVQKARRTGSTLAGLKERLDAAEKETFVLRRQEQQYRDQLARLLTHRRDQEADAFATADSERRSLDKELKAAEQAWKESVSEHAVATEKERKAGEDEAESAQTIADAVTAELLPEGTHAADHDKFLSDRAKSARQAQETAKELLRAIEGEIAAQQKAAEKARRDATSARTDSDGAQRRLEDITARVAALTHDERLLDIAGALSSDLWATRTSLTDLLMQAAAAGDTEASNARRNANEAQRTIDSVAEDGLLPGSDLTEKIACAIKDTLEIPVWTGWRWLADTRTPEAAAEFAVARPEIASGLILGQPGLLDAAVAAAKTVPRDTAVWIGAVTDSAATVACRPGAEDGTCGQLLLPHPGAYDRAAAREMLIAAQTAFDESRQSERTAAQHSTNARNVLAGLTQIWNDFAEDPRPGLEEKLRTARERLQTAVDSELEANRRLEDLAGKQADRKRDQEHAQQVVEQSTETRRLLAAAVTASRALDQLRRQLPGLRLAISESLRLVGELADRKTAVGGKLADVTEQARLHRHRRDDAAEALRTAGLSAVTEGPVPEDDELTIRARLEAVEETIAENAVDPGLHEQAARVRQTLADIYSTLDARPDIRLLAEEFADTDGARHPVALDRSINEAVQREADARQECGRAEAAAEAAMGQYRQRASDRSADRTSPDVEGFPADREVRVPGDADRHAERLDELANEMGNTARAEEQAVKDAAETAESAERDLEIVEASVSQLRYLADPSIGGQPIGDVSELRLRLSSVADRVRQSSEQLTASIQAEESAERKIRASANGPEARKIEEAGDPRIADLISRLRGDAQLPEDAERIAGQLEQRAASLRDDLDRHDQNVRACARMLHIQATTAIRGLRAYQNHSRLPEGLGNWSQRQFVIIDHEPEPDDESVAIDRVARVVHSLLTQEAGKRSDAKTLLFSAARALVEAPFKVRLLKPHTDLSLDRVDIAELKNFSCGQRVTAGVLLYAAMTRVRAAGDDATSIGWLWLDNPFGQASADSFIRTMRFAADQLGLQLVFTAAPKDQGALSMFDRTIALARRSRPSSKEKVVVLAEKEHEVTDLLLIQKDVLAVLGE
jgi:hypothetical protein